MTVPDTLAQIAFYFLNPYLDSNNWSFAQRRTLNKLTGSRIPLIDFRIGTSALLWVLSLILLCSQVNAQNSTQSLDSLEQELQQSSGLERARILNAYSRELEDTDLGEAADAAREALRIGNRFGDDSVRAVSHDQLATLSYFQGKFDSAFLHQRAALGIWEQTKDTLGIAQSFNSLGALFDVSGNLDSALHYYFLALDLHTNLDNEDGISATLSNLAVLYYASGDYKEAIRYFERSLDIDLKNDAKQAATISMSNIGACYQGLGELEKALDFHTRALELRREIGPALFISRSLNNIGLVQMDLGNYNKALASLTEAADLKRQLGNSYELGRTLNNIGRVYLAQNRFSEALKPLIEAKSILDTTKSPPLQEANAGFLSKAYAGSGMFEEAYSSEMTRKKISDSLTLAEQDSKNAELMAKFDAIQREIEIDSLTYIQDLRDREIESINRQTNFLVLGLVIFGILTIMIFVFFLQKRTANRKLKVLNSKLAERNRQIKDQNAEIRDKSEELSKKNEEILQINSNLESIVEERTRNLSEANKELDTFLYQTSHALRAPLMRIIGLFSIAKESESEVVASEMYGKIDETISRMDRMLYKLLDVQEMKLRDPLPEKVNFKQLIDEIVREIKEKSDLEAPILNLDLPQESCPVPDRQVVRLVLLNVLENAWHFRSENPDTPHSIDIAVRHRDDQLHLSITDNGIGIPEQEHEVVFQMFHRATHKSNGTGLGLYVTQKALDLVNGELKLQSEEGDYTKIEVLLPV